MNVDTVLQAQHLKKYYRGVRAVEDVSLLETDKIFKRALFWIELAILAVVIIGIDVIQYVISLAMPSATTKQLIASLIWPSGLENAAQLYA